MATEEEGETLAVVSSFRIPKRPTATGAVIRW